MSNTKHTIPPAWGGYFLDFPSTDPDESLISKMSVQITVPLPSNAERDEALAKKGENEEDIRYAFGLNNAESVTTEVNLSMNVVYDTDLVIPRLELFGGNGLIAPLIWLNPMDVIQCSIARQNPEDRAATCKDWIFTVAINGKMPVAYTYQARLPASEWMGSVMGAAIITTGRDDWSELLPAGPVDFSFITLENFNGKTLPSPTWTFGPPNQDGAVVQENPFYGQTNCLQATWDLPPDEKKS